MISLSMSTGLIHILLQSISGCSGPIWLMVHDIHDGYTDNNIYAWLYSPSACAAWQPGALTAQVTALHASRLRCCTLVSVASARKTAGMFRSVEVSQGVSYPEWSEVLRFPRVCRTQCVKSGHSRVHRRWPPWYQVGARDPIATSRQIPSTHSSITTCTTSRTATRYSTSAHVYYSLPIICCTTLSQ